MLTAEVTILTDRDNGKFLEEYEGRRKRRGEEEVEDGPSGVLESSG